MCENYIHFINFRSYNLLILTNVNSPIIIKLLFLPIWQMKMKEIITFISKTAYFIIYQNS